MEIQIPTAETCADGGEHEWKDNKDSGVYAPWYDVLCGRCGCKALLNRDDGGIMELEVPTIYAELAGNDTAQSPGSSGGQYQEGGEGK